MHGNGSRILSVAVLMQWCCVHGTCMQIDLLLLSEQGVPDAGVLADEFNSADEIASKLFSAYSVYLQLFSSHALWTILGCQAAQLALMKSRIHCLKQSTSHSAKSNGLHTTHKAHQDAEAQHSISLRPSDNHKSIYTNQSIHNAFQCASVLLACCRPFR